MKAERYEFLSDGYFLNFEFVSEGPKGKFKKLIRFTPRKIDGVSYFNLSFGDWNNEKMEIDDRVVTNNSDSKKVLATVAAAVLAFTEQYPDIGVYAEGSTAARTRLYQMGICANWNDIEPLFYVYGWAGGKWHLFQKNVNYEAFFVEKK